jgi:hypothetical protein
MKPYRDVHIPRLGVTRVLSPATALLVFCAAPLMSQTVPVATISQTVPVATSSPDTGTASLSSLATGMQDDGWQPLSSETPYQRFSLSEYRSRVLGPGALFRDIFISSFGQTVRQPTQWPRTWGGYSNRLTSRVGSEAISQTVVFGLSAALDQRPARFAPCDCRGFGPRLLHAALIPWEMSSPHGTHLSLLAPTSHIASALLATSLQPGGFSAQNGLRGGALGIALFSASDVLREFWPWARHPFGL